MKYFIIPLLILLISCGSSHKVVNSSKKAVDSSSSSFHDSSAFMKEDDIGDMFHIHGVHIRVEYPADTALAEAKQRPANDTAIWTPIYIPRKHNVESNQFSKLISNIISASGNAGRLQPSSIDITVGDASDSIYEWKKIDSVSSRIGAKVDVTTTEAAKSKEITHTGLSIGLKIGIGFLLFIFLLIAAWKVYQKIKP